MTKRPTDRQTYRPTERPSNKSDYKRHTYLQTNEKTVLKSCHSLKISSSFYLLPHTHTHKHTHTSLYTNKQRKLHGSRISLLPHSLLPTFVVPTLASQASDPRQPSTHFYTPTVLLAGWLAACLRHCLTYIQIHNKAVDRPTNERQRRRWRWAKQSQLYSIYPSIQPTRQAASTATPRPALPGCACNEGNKPLC